MYFVRKAFYYRKKEIDVAKCNDDIWFKSKDVAKALGYVNPGKAIRMHVDLDDRMTIDDMLMHLLNIGLPVLRMRNAD